MQNIHYSSLLQLLVEFSEYNDVRFQFIFLLKPELQFVRSMQISVKKIVLQKQIQRQTSHFCNFNLVAKTSLKNIVYMPFFFRAIDYKLQDREFILP